MIYGTYFEIKNTVQSPKKMKQIIILQMFSLVKYIKDKMRKQHYIFK